MKHGQYESMSVVDGDAIKGNAARGIAHFVLLRRRGPVCRRPWTRRAMMPPTGTSV
jgi:hypothetical protein